MSPDGSPGGRGRGVRPARRCGGGARRHGALVYTIGGGRSVVDGFYFAIATLTTPSVENPELVLDDPWLEVFTAFYVLLGIGILVGIAGRLGVALVALRLEDRLHNEARVVC